MAEFQRVERLNRPAFDAGLAAYRRGVSVLDVAIKSWADMDRAFAQTPDGEERPDPRAIEAESKSFILGFGQGLVEDIRKVAGGGRSGQRA